MKDAGGAAASVVVGAVAGKATMTYLGMSAVGMVGSGTGYGAAAGPVGMVIGGLAGLALYGVIRVFVIE